MPRPPAPRDGSGRGLRGPGRHGGHHERFRLPDPSPEVALHLSAIRTGGAAASTALLLLLAPLPYATAAQEPSPGTLQQEFDAAAARYRVPPSVLLGVSYLQSRWDTHAGAPSATGGYGPMHLTDARSRSPQLASGDGMLAQAATLTGMPVERLRSDPAANVRGGAALLAAAQRKAGGELSEDPADWYGAVARFAGSDDPAAARAYADEVFSVIRAGQRRTTDSGEPVALPAAPAVATPVAPRSAPANGVVECPLSVSCTWVPAPYQKIKGSKDDDYGNHDPAGRPDALDIDYIVVHDTEGYWQPALDQVQDPTGVSWHYTLRPTDGAVAQHVRTKDVAWHSGNWYVNTKSVGLEHQGFLTEPDAWYTEAVYRSSARLVRHLAAKYGIPLDRQHIIGHDNVPGALPATVRGMHTDPGPYWDWAHYFELLGAPFTAKAGPSGEAVTIRPDYAEHRPAFTGCERKKPTAAPCPAHGSGAVRLHTAPDPAAPLVKDIGLRPDGRGSTTGVSDTGARASTGQRFAVAGRQGDWTAIWYLGQRAWFHNPAGRPAAVNAAAPLLTPREGLKAIPVYGRAYPEASAYPAGIPVQPVVPLAYRIPAGQRYVVGERTPGEYFFAKEYGKPGRVVRGGQIYYEIQYGHRIGYVKESDVRLLGPTRD
ncbi:N-acetylmuramoyl-L-alanine amidase [Streptomyces sp. NPDC051561]|uniref:N-acetylmuramoyl-L-alanine amidase n=1 Tax=Streptomyces sp. NPDC051561 TaxID=3365658 RepID=UPI00379C66D6